mmetsp:Transcript_112978/g.258759  ORF Transcript_112978/g.258759 Transcript_112978/m.258759 type:complete len:218 (-) Transcript_112978:163-816(-)
MTTIFRNICQASQEKVIKRCCWWSQGSASGSASVPRALISATSFCTSSSASSWGSSSGGWGSAQAGWSLGVFSRLRQEGAVIAACTDDRPWWRMRPRRMYACPLYPSAKKSVRLTNQGISLSSPRQNHGLLPVFWFTFHWCGSFCQFHAAHISLARKIHTKKQRSMKTTDRVAMTRHSPPAPLFAPNHPQTISGWSLMHRSVDIHSTQSQGVIATLS